jgi:hypothetical protein
MPFAKRLPNSTAVKLPGTASLIAAATSSEAAWIFFQWACVQDDNREPTILQVLLIAKILIGRDHDLEAICLSYPEQFAVRQFRPTLLIRSRNGMIGEHLPQPMWHILIEQNLYGLVAAA